MTTLVTIVIPTFNHDLKLQRAIDSVLKQTLQDFEIIVIDNNSTDNTDSVVAAFNDSRIRQYKINNNGVIAKSRNLGIKYSNSKFIAFLDSDDWWYFNKLEVSIATLEKGYDLVYHDLWLVNNKTKISFNKTVGARKVKIPIYNHLLNFGNSIPNSSVVLRSDIVKKVGPISEVSDLKGIEDFDYWLKVSKVTENFYFLPKVLGYCFYADGNFSSNMIQQLIGLQKIVILHYQSYISERKPLPFHISFNIAKAAYRSGNYSLSKKHLKILFFQKSTLTNRLKVMLILIYITLMAKKNINL
jgi:glycosyltransferase involved in cell wall biosynthesis